MSICQPCSLNQTLSLCTARLTPENYHLLNEAAFDQMKDGVMIVNTSRGALIDSQAAIEALKNQKIGSLGMGRV